MALTEQQQQQVQTFVDFTHWSDSQAAAIRLLEATEWNVEAAVSLHFDGGVTPSLGGGISAGSSSSNPPSLMSQLMEDDLQSDAAEIAPRISPTPATYTARGSGLSIIQTVLMAPFSLGYRVFSTVMYFLSYVLPFAPRLAGYRRPAPRVSRPERADPKTVAARLARWFEDTYGVDAVAQLPLFVGGYTEALDMAKANLKYLVVVLQSREHDLTSAFNRGVLLSNDVKALLTRSDIVLWAGDMAESEAYQVANVLSVTKFPFACLIGPSPKTPTSNTVVMTVLARLSGLSTAQQFVSTIEEKMEAHQPKIMALVLDKQERDLARRLREEQDSAYERSLEADRQRTRDRLQKEEEERAEQERLKREQEEKERKLRLHKDWRRAMASTFVDEPANSAETVRIGIRLATGERVVRRFARDSSVETIYRFVECYEHIKAGDFIPVTPELEEYEPVYSFELVVPMPRQVVSASEQIASYPALCPSGSLVVEELD